MSIRVLFVAAVLFIDACSATLWQAKQPSQPVAPAEIRQSDAGGAARQTAEATGQSTEVKANEERPIWPWVTLASIGGGVVLTYLTILGTVITVLALTL